MSIRKIKALFSWTIHLLSIALFLMQAFGHSNDIQYLPVDDIKVGEYIVFLKSSADFGIFYNNGIANQIVAISKEHHLDYEVAPGVNDNDLLLGLTANQREAFDIWNNAIGTSPLMMLRGEHESYKKGDPEENANRFNANDPHQEHASLLEDNSSLAKRGDMISAHRLEEKDDAAKSALEITFDTTRDSLCVLDSREAILAYQLKSKNSLLQQKEDELNQKKQELAQLTASRKKGTYKTMLDYFRFKKQKALVQIDEVKREQLENDIAKLRGERNDLKRESTAINEQFEATKSTMSMRKAAREELINQQKRNKKREEELLASQKEQERVNSLTPAERIAENITSFKLQIEETKRIYQLKINLLAETWRPQRRAELTKEIDALVLKMRNLENQCFIAQKKLQQLHGPITELSHDQKIGPSQSLETSESSALGASALPGTLQEELSHNQQQVSNLQEKISQKEGHLHLLQHQLTNASILEFDQNNKLRKEIDLTRQECTELKNEIQSLQEASTLLYLSKEQKEEVKSEGNALMQDLAAAYLVAKAEYLDFFAIREEFKECDQFMKEFKQSEDRGMQIRKTYLNFIREREQHKENLLTRTTLNRLNAYLRRLEANDKIIASAIKFQRINDAWNEACTLLHKTYWERLEAIRSIATFRREGRCLDENSGTPQLISDPSILYQQAEQCHRNAIKAAKKFHLLMNVPDLDIEQTKLRENQQNLLTTREKEKQIFGIVGIQSETLTEEEIHQETNLPFEDRKNRAQQDLSQAIREFEEAHEKREKAKSHLQNQSWFCEDYGKLFEIRDELIDHADLKNKVEQATTRLLRAAKRIANIRLAQLSPEEWNKEIDRIVSLKSHEREKELLELSVSSEEVLSALKENTEPFNWSLPIVAQAALVQRKWNRPDKRREAEDWQRIQELEQQAKIDRRNQQLAIAAKVGMAALRVLL